MTLTGIGDTVRPGLAQSLSYTATNRLASASGNYGTFAWAYDAVGNRTSETLNGTVSTYAYPSTSNRLSSITPGTATPRSLTYDSAGNIATDSRSGAVRLTYQYDVERRLAKASRPAALRRGRPMPMTCVAGWSRASSPSRRRRRARPRSTPTISSITRSSRSTPSAPAHPSAP